MRNDHAVCPIGLCGELLHVYVFNAPDTLNTSNFTLLRMKKCTNIRCLAGDLNPHHTCPSCGYALHVNI